MKCNNCGFQNNAELARCSKCNTELLVSRDSKLPQNNFDTLSGQSSDVFYVDPTGNLNKDQKPDFFSKTLLGEQAKEPFIDRPNSRKTEETDGSTMNKCPNCSYPIMSVATICPNCNLDLKAINSTNKSSSINQQNYSGTIDPYSRKGFSLRPIINGEPGNSSLEFNGTTQLNRENTIKDNMTITSKIQAEVKFENGEWFLIDKSEQKTTFIRPGEPIKLNKGDIILLGDTKFIFD